MTKAEAIKLIRVILAIYPKALYTNIEFTGETWALAMPDVDYEKAQTAIIKKLRHSPFTPGVSDIISAVKELYPTPFIAPTESDAWQIVSKAVSNLGYARFPTEWPHPAIAAAVRSITPERLCHDENVAATFAHFKAIYKTEVERLDNKTEAVKITGNKDYFNVIESLAGDLSRKMILPPEPDTRPAEMSEQQINEIRARL